MKGSGTNQDLVWPRGLTAPPELPHLGVTELKSSRQVPPRIARCMEKKQAVETPSAVLSSLESTLDAEFAGMARSLPRTCTQLLRQAVGAFEARAYEAVAMTCRASVEAAGDAPGESMAGPERVRPPAHLAKKGRARGYPGLRNVFGRPYILAGGRIQLVGD